MKIGELINYNIGDTVYIYNREITYTRCPYCGGTKIETKTYAPLSVVINTIEIDGEMIYYIGKPEGRKANIKLTDADIFSTQEECQLYCNDLNKTLKGNNNETLA